MVRSLHKRFLGLMLTLPLLLPPNPLAAQTASSAQTFVQPHAGELLAGLRRLGVVGSVLYIAAHPDDENSRLLAWLVGARGLAATYLSLTRGEGGQNLIGTEQDELLGLLRTHELLAARRIDGAGQLFTRARDLGYTKRADEALELWGHEAVLGDVVLAIRRTRPDVVITRFNTQPPNHGHHTASAMLAAEAFAAAADAARFPEQLGLAPAWQSQRLLHNVSTWNLPEKADLSRYLQLDVGGYDPLRGRSWPELAAQSRSQHKSQGFGVAAERGPTLEYFAHLAGKPSASGPFDGIDLSWKRIPGGGAVQKRIADVTQAFAPLHPELSIPGLWKVHAAIADLPETQPWRRQKLQEVQALILACAGVVLAARAAEAVATPGEVLTVQVTALNRSPAAARLLRVELPGAVTEPAAALGDGVPIAHSLKLRLPEDAAISTPYWLRHTALGGLDQVPELELIGVAEGECALAATFTLEIGGKSLSVQRPVRHVWVDPVRGELSRPFEVAPALGVTLDRSVVVVPNGQPQAVTVQISAARDVTAAVVRPELPPGWTATPAQAVVTLGRGKGLAQRFVLSPPTGATAALPFRAVAPLPFRVLAIVDGRSDSFSQRSVNYDHVPPLTARQPAAGTLVPLEIQLGVKHIGYIPGPGDRVAESLAAIGYDVTLLPPERLATESLERFEAILVGIRAFNQAPQLAAQQGKLLQFVERGGRVIVQYQTNSRIAALSVPIGPYPLEIGRDRVTDETAAMVPLLAADPLLQRPNLLGPADFAGWVQERGLYFASKWDARYRPVFAMHDAGEADLTGGLLVARVGKGAFVYTGIAFFRQLPAGVPGAYRLLANLLAQ